MSKRLKTSVIIMALIISHSAAIALTSLKWHTVTESILGACSCSDPDTLSVKYTWHLMPKGD